MANGLQVIVAGPERGLPMFEEIAERLCELGHRCSVMTRGSLTDHPKWSRADILISALLPVGQSDLATATNLRAIVSPLLGYEWIDAEAATHRGIAVVNGEAQENRESLAEATILLMLAILYQLPRSMQLMAEPTRPPLSTRHMLKGKTVGIIGYGGIARSIVHRLSNWDCQLLIHTRTPDKDRENLCFVTLNRLLAQSDVVLVMTRLDEETYHLLDEKRLALMKASALLVNTARGAIVDEMALVDFLARGRLAGAALDVFEVEPLPMDHPMRNLPNVILTPHAIGHTAESMAAIPKLTVQNVIELAAGRLPTSCKNPAVYRSWSARWSLNELGTGA